MRAPFEAKYLSIVWQDKQHAKKVIECDRPIEVEKLSDDYYQVDIVNYSKIDNGRQGQFAIRLVENRESTRPFFWCEGDEKSELIPVKDPATGKIWWVEGDTWSGDKWQSRIYRSVGRVYLQVGESKCEVNISTSTFTYQELDSYLQDFRNGFYELILDDSSYIKGAGKLTEELTVDRSALRTVSMFIEHAEKIVHKPKAELRETQRTQLQRKIKPAPRTFVELLAKGYGRALTSRMYEESFDVPENRYVHYVLKKTYSLLCGLAKVSESYEERLSSSIDLHKQRLSTFSNSKSINKIAVLSDINSKRERLESLDSYFSENLGLPVGTVRKNHCPWVLCVNVKKSTGWEDDSYFVDVRLPDDHEWFMPDGGFVTLELMFDGNLESGYEYRLYGDIFFNGGERTKNGKLWYKYKVFSLHSLKVIGGVKRNRLVESLHKFSQAVDELEMADWIRPMSREELDQQRREIASIEKIINLLRIKENNVSYLKDAIRPKLRVLKKILDVFVSHGVGVDSGFPNSMVFLHNPNYQGLHSNFKKIMNLSSVSEDDVLFSLQRVDEIGLVNVSVLYERWCLLQIIRILVQVFLYKPQGDWKRKLIEQVLDNKNNVAIEFHNESVSRKIKLWYEKTLANNKRPDFVLDVEAVHYEGGEPLTGRLVFDAKFYQDIDNKRHGGISTIVNNLYYEKDYSEGGKNAVFIIHPSKGAVPEIKTPQEWAANSYYGEVGMFDWDEGIRSTHNHEYGAVYLSPVAGANYIDDLQRAIAMFLQYGIEDNNLGPRPINPVPGGKIFCAVCGSGDYYSELKPTKNGSKWWITCVECNHFTVYNYCGSPSCFNRLIKNGGYWTYHAMEPLDPLNIKCPSCGGVL